MNLYYLTPDALCPLYSYSNIETVDIIGACPESCFGSCPSDGMGITTSTATTTVLASTTPTLHRCEDTIDTCEAYFDANLCANGDVFEEYMKALCTSTCQHCPPEVVAKVSIAPLTTAESKSFPPFAPDSVYEVEVRLCSRCCSNLVPLLTCHVFPTLLFAQIDHLDN